MAEYMQFHTLNPPKVDSVYNFTDSRMCGYEEGGGLNRHESLVFDVGIFVLI